MSEQINAIAAFDEIVSKLREPPVVSADAREIADQLRALADTVWAGRDEWVVATARKAQRAGAPTQRRSFWRELRSDRFASQVEKMAVPERRRLWRPWCRSA